MEVPDLIYAEVWEKARLAFENHENWVAYNNTLLFVHSDDIRFFNNREDAAEFAESQISEYDCFRIERVESLTDFKNKVERIMPGLEYKPSENISIIKESAPSFFPKELLLKNKTIIMNTENQEFLKTQLQFLGFDEGLQSQLEKMMKEGKPEFSLTASTEFGKDKMQAVIHFRHSEKDGKEAYFCNHYIASLEKEGQQLSQFVYVNNKGQNITFKESCNLLNGRSVFKEITPREGAPYKAWVKIDHENMDTKTGYPKLKQFGGNYGFDLKEAVERMPFKELGYPDQEKTLLKSLQKGNAYSATLIKGSKEEKVFIEANPQFKTLNMYDKNGEKLFYPMQKVAEKFGQAPADARRQETAMVGEPGERYDKKNLLSKDKPSNGLIPKKNTSAKKTARKIQ